MLTPKYRYQNICLHNFNIENESYQYWATIT